VSFTFIAGDNVESRPTEYQGVLRADSQDPWDGTYRGSAWVSFQTVENVYADPCTGVPMNPPVGPSGADLAAALAAIPGVVASAPVDIRGVGHPMQHVQLTLDDDIDCRADAVHLWYSDAQDIEGSSRRMRAADSRLDVWIVDVDGQRFVVDRERTPGDLPVTLPTATSIRFRDIPAEVLVYVDSILATCELASERFSRDPDVMRGFRGPPEFSTLDAAAAHAEAAIVISEAAFRELGALRVPENMRADASLFQEPLGEAVEALRQVAAAARAGDAERVSTLLAEAYRLTIAPWDAASPVYTRPEALGLWLLAPSFLGCVLPSFDG
jgi:hypothetical protein